MIKLFFRKDMIFVFMLGFFIEWGRNYSALNSVFLFVFGASILYIPYTILLLSVALFLGLNFTTVSKANAWSTWCKEQEFNTFPYCKKYEGDTKDIGAIEYFVDSSVLNSPVKRLAKWISDYYAHDHFIVYWGPEPGVYDQESIVVYGTEYEIHDDRKEIFVVVKAFDDHNRPSEFSNEVSFRRGPAAPQGFMTLSFK